MEETKPEQSALPHPKPFQLYTSCDKRSFNFTFANSDTCWKAAFSYSVFRRATWQLNLRRCDAIQLAHTRSLGIGFIIK